MSEPLPEGGQPLRCAVLDDYQDVARSVADWSALAGVVEVTFFSRHLDPTEVTTALAGYQVVVAMRERTRFPAEVLAALPGLRLLVTTGMRNASIDLAAAADNGVVVCGTTSRTEPTVELTWALILGLSRHLVDEHHALRTSGPWQSTLGADLAGHTLGLLGFGKIGSRVARVGQAFGMDVQAWSENLTDERTGPAGVRLCASKQQLLSTSDIVSIHLVLGERTRGLVDETAFRAMRPQAVLVNTSRAAIVDQSALLRALREGWIAGAGMDVYEQEPLPADHPLRSAPGVLTTPHLGYVTRDNYAGYYRQAVQDIIGWLAGEPVRRIA